MVENNNKSRLFLAEMQNHDFLWFSSFEISKTSMTSAVLHNYGLTYAINHFSYGFFRGCSPRYEEDLALMDSYATPALPLSILRKTKFTQNAINSKTLKTEAAPGKNSPALGWRIVIDPTWSKSDLSSGFKFYVFADESFRPPGIIRLGKKGCPVRIKWTEFTSTRKVFRKEATIPTHAVNPLDVSGKVISCSPTIIPPHMLFERAEIENDWFIFHDHHIVHVPARIINNINNAD
jgi:CRISPR type I-D-associated protein Csc1